MAKIKSLADSPGKLVKLLFTLMRITIGWHFLFEGISKLAIPGWSSAPYLMESKWLFSGFFHWIVSHPSALAFTDFLNIWGLTGGTRWGGTVRPGIRTVAYGKKKPAGEGGGDEGGRI